MIVVALAAVLLSLLRRTPRSRTDDEQPEPTAAFGGREAEPSAPAVAPAPPSKAVIFAPPSAIENITSAMRAIAGCVPVA